MPRELKLVVSCKCGAWDVGFAPTEMECEVILERRGWTVTAPEKCPACKRKPVKGEQQ